MNTIAMWLRAPVLVGPLFFPFSAMAVSEGGLQSIKLLTPQVGWAANSADLFWTTDAGNHWETRTPRSASKEVIEDVFFLNTSVGWVLLAGADANDQVRFDLASTDDAGKTWQVAHIEMPRDTADDFSGRGSMFFTDPLHGWMDLSINSGSAFNPGALLYTVDGGVIWSYAAGQPGVAGSLCFFDARDGMLSGGSGNTEFYVTHDGSKSWAEVSLTASQVLPADFPTFSTPTCNGKIGFVPVTYSGREGTKAALVLFSTVDAGREFHIDRVVPTLGETSPGQEITTALVDSHLISLGVSNRTGLLLTAVPRSGNQMSATFQVGGTPIAVLKASFSTPSQGWALTSTGLLSTADGGGTWTEITPNRERRVLPLESDQLGAVDSTQALGTAPSRGRLFDQSSAAAAVSKNTRLGFDIGLVPLTAQMNIWWQSSPYFESGLYLPGAANKKKDINLNSTWVSTVSGQGWGLIPIWVGPQAPCVLPATKRTKLKLFTTVNPYSQGQAEAAKAIAAVKALSSSLGPVVYYDMENYDTTVATGCSATVIQFLNGWVNAMQASGYKAGIYGNPGPAQQDFSQLSPLPDDAWISWPPLPTMPPVVSIWGLQKLCDFYTKTPCAAPLWYDSQRIHQYLIDNVETWGGLSLKVDRNVVDADVAVSSTLAKPYTAFTFVTPSCSNLGAPVSFFGINNLGTAVGNFTDTNNNDHAFLYSTANGCNVIPDPPVYIKYMGAMGINDAGKVGIWSQGESGTYYYIYNSKTQKYSASLTLRNAIIGINDGDYVVTDNGPYQGFFQNADYNGISRTLASLSPMGLNGNNVIVGSTSSTCGGLYYPLSQMYMTCLPRGSAGINNSLQILVTNGGGGPNYIFDYPSGTSSIALPSGDVAFGINDYSEIVGFDHNGAPFIACPAGYPVCP